jgi:hypothetical protein
MASTTIPPTTEPATIPPIFFELGGVGVVVGAFFSEFGKTGRIRWSKKRNFQRHSLRQMRFLS